jgi:putative DeoR family transcriptional regulator, stage III sporulation protein D
LKDHIEKRVLAVGKYIIRTKTTIRKAAIAFGVSKSTIHKDTTERLLEINPQIATEVKNILEYNKAVRNIRGGNATKLKYKTI